MYALALGFLCGVASLYQLPELPVWASPYFQNSYLFSFLLLWLAWRLPRLRFVCALLIGLIYSGGDAYQQLQQRIPAALEGQELIVQGEISDLPARYEDFTRFRLKTLATEDTWPAAGQQLLLSWYQDTQAIPELIPGQRCRLRVRLRAPHSNLNPGVFDREAWYFREQIQALGYVRADAANQCQAMNYWSVDYWRYRLEQRLAPVLDTAPHGGMLRALILGDRQQMSDAEWQVLRRTGTNHLMAISGLHIGWMALLSFWLMHFIWARCGSAALHWPAPRVAAWFCLMPAIAYAALAGFSVSTQRALIMLLIFMGGYLYLRRARPAYSLSLALIAVLLWQPSAVSGSALWMSFGAVAVILLVMQGQLQHTQADWFRRLNAFLTRHRQLRFFGFFLPLKPVEQTALPHQERSWRQGFLLTLKQAFPLRLQVWIFLGIGPLLVVFFGQVTLISPLANFFAVPWVGWLVVPPALLGSILLPLSPELGSTLLYFSAYALHALWAYLEWCSSLDWSFFLVPTVEPIHLFFFVAGIVLWLLPSGLPGRWLAGLCLLPLLLTALLPASHNPPAQNEFDFYLLDTGQSLSSVIQTRYHTLVYDTGLAYRNGYGDMGRSVVNPFLQHLGVRELDLLMVSHRDEDHSGGALSILQVYPRTPVISGDPDFFPERTAFQCRPQHHWRWDGVDFEVLHPQQPGRWSGNNRSCVLRVRTGDHAVLLTGDIEADVEQALLAQNPGALSASLLQVPHHGSKTSSSAEFVAAVRSQYALFAVGYRNTHRHPRADVVQRYQQQGSQLLRTDAHGGLYFRLSPQELSSADATRRERRRFWHYQLSN